MVMPGRSPIGTTGKLLGAARIRLLRSVEAVVKGLFRDWALPKRKVFRAEQYVFSSIQNNLTQ